VPTAELAGFDIAYETYGKPANPPVLLVHSLYHDHLSMATLAERLSDSYFVVAHDAIGHGRSEKADRYTLFDQGRVLDELIVHLGLGSAYVVGESMGSYIAAQAAILQPSLVAKLVLLAPRAWGVCASIDAYLREAGINPATCTLEQIWLGVADGLWGPDTLPERRAEIESDMQPTRLLSKAEVAAASASLNDFDLRPELAKITAKTLVVVGRYDAINPPKLGHEVARLIPGARFELFEHSGHLLKWEEQVKLGDVLRQFFAR
jgi:pimeloyl-ACP methyl ester carboxylesterase